MMSLAFGQEYIAMRTDSMIIPFVSQTRHLTLAYYSVPGILNQLGPDSLASLRKLAESYQAVHAARKEDDDDEIPDLVENFDQSAKIEETD
ncbi:hypothetical protein BC936DRAFT_145729 [Jimgerdemannia flammicorona]|uniref:Uncharacterized protein n=1 Tax=Jimgerdemannia flammicorona TaxID=994334 RepID=A0A433D9Y9_9FUNG|nr:hypothetical protein BC936DRAFT_145729 [Jimgerdemannia flammicorona]